MGLRAEVERLSLEGFRARCHRFYRPVNARLVITGAIDAAATLALVERTFGHLPAGEQVQPVAAREPVWSGRFDVDLAPPGTADADCEREVCISCPAPPSRSEPAFVTLGYLVQPATNAQQGFQFDTDTEHRTVAFHWTGDDRPVDEIVRRFDEVIARFAVRSPTAADLAPVRDAYDTFFTGYSKSSELRGECAHPPAQFARYVAEAAKDGLDRDRFCTALAAVTQADLRRVAATWLAPERRVVAVLRRARTPTMNMKAVLVSGTARIRVVLTWDAAKQVIRHRIGEKVQVDEAAFEESIRAHAMNLAFLPNYHITIDADPAIPWREVNRTVGIARQHGFDKFEYTNGDPPAAGAGSK